VVGASGIPQQNFWNRIAGNLKAGDISPVGCLLRVNCNEIVDGSVGRNNDVFGFNLVAAIGVDFMRIYFRGVSITKDLAAHFGNRE
jgi:hypothetical protein